MNGVSLVFRHENQILAVQAERGYNLPSATLAEPEDGVLTGTYIRMAANELFNKFTKKKAVDDTLVPLYRGHDDVYGMVSCYLVSADLKTAPKGTHWVEPKEILLGDSGLFAREAFGKLEIMNRPPLNLESLYRISQKALSQGSSKVMEAIDMVVDEMALLVDIKKPWAIDTFLRNVDVRRLHPDLIYTMKSLVEEIPDLPSRDGFVQAASARLAEIDGTRLKIRFEGHEDVRASALKIYRKTGKEFGKALREGTLSKRFPNMRSIAEAEARMKEEGASVKPDFFEIVASQKEPMPVESWPEDQRDAALRQGPRQDIVEPTKHPRGITFEEPKKPVRLEITHVPNGPPSEFSKQIRNILANTGGSAEITFDEDGSPEVSATTLTVECDGCGTEQPGGKFCSHCGKQILKRVCVSCGSILSETVRFCSECGTRATPSN